MSVGVYLLLSLSYAIDLTGRSTKCTNEIIKYTENRQPQTRHEYLDILFRAHYEIWETVSDCRRMATERHSWT